MRIELIRHFEIADVEPQWQALQEKSSCSFFQSWHWIGPWLSNVCSIPDAMLVRFFDADKLVGLCILESYKFVRRGFFEVNVSYLHDSHRPMRNMCVEYNMPLVVSGYEEAVFRALVNIDLNRLSCDEMQINRGCVPSKDNISELMEGGNYSVEKEPTWGIDLTSIPLGIDLIVDGMKKKRRWQLRKSLSEYAARGGFVIEVASSPEQAFEFLDRLEKLHTRRWEEAGAKGSFANPMWKAFIEAVIRTGFKHGVIQLIQLTAGKESVGFLLNFVWRNTVYVLQSGFDLSSNKHEQPGYLSHIYAADLNRSLGNHYYDFMAGESLYKATLSNSSKMLYNITIQQDSVGLRFEGLLLKAYRRIRRMTAAGK